MANSNYKSPYAQQRQQQLQADAQKQQQADQSGGSGDPYFDPFKNTPYYNDADFQNVIKNYQQFAQHYGVDTAQPTYQQVSGYADNFKNQFKNFVGRDPNPDEYNQFFKFLGQEGPWAQNAQVTAGKIGPEITGLISNNFTRTAQDEAQKQLQTQAQAAVAPGSAFDVWQQGYSNSVNDVEKSLQDYQSKLFEKIRPNLITSLQSQGLLNSGALNEAFAGSAKDLADANSQYLASARGAINQDIANQKYSLQSAPQTYQFQNTVGLPAQLYQGGQQALQNVWQGTMANIDANNQRNLLDYQNSTQPRSNPLAQYGGLILGGIAGGIPGAIGSYYANKK